MDSLRATYTDDDEETAEPPPTTTAPTREAPTLTNEPQLTPITIKEQSSTPISELDPLSETELSEDEDEEESSSSEEEPQQHQTPSSINPEEQEDSTPQPKKHKPLSSLLPTPPTLPKKKPKPNNVWAKPTSRKGKKKPKTPAHQLFDEKSVQISPLPRLTTDKTDDTPDMVICLSKVNKAEKVELSEDRLSAGSCKGYRMVRATRGVVSGAWYFEIKVERLGETGHTRLGWSMAKGDLQAPVGYDGWSFGFRDVDGSKVHKAVREKYGEGGYEEGDVIGCYVSLPDGESYAPKTPSLVWYKGMKYAYPRNGKEEPDKVVPGSEISFFKNGVCQGVAFKDLFGGCYYPAASMYTLPNQPNCVVKFNFGPDFDFFPESFGDRPLPKPMIEVPYQAVDGIAENGESSEKPPQPKSAQLLKFLRNANE